MHRHVVELAACKAIESKESEEWIRLSTAWDTSDFLYRAWRFGMEIELMSGNAKDDDIWMIPRTIQYSTSHGHVKRLMDV
jgi:hypothetical protein